MGMQVVLYPDRMCFSTGSSSRQANRNTTLGSTRGSGDSRSGRRHDGGKGDGAKFVLLARMHIPLQPPKGKALSIRWGSRTVSLEALSDNEAEVIHVTYVIRMTACKRQDDLMSHALFVFLNKLNDLIHDVKRSFPQPKQQSERIHARIDMSVSPVVLCMLPNTLS